MLKPLADLKHLYCGKVRDVYDAGDGRLLLVTSPRVSAYDVVFPEPVPRKAEVLNLLSAYWFHRTAHIIPNHLIETRAEALFGAGSRDARGLRGRVALTRAAEPVRFECVVRGHLDGSGWREYEQHGTVCGQAAPTGLSRYDKLPEPLFTPATKAETGHDINITPAQLAEQAGADLAALLEEKSLAIYDFAYQELLCRGVLLLDTKFEFGFVDGALILIDEALTPDSSRFRVAAADGDGEALALDKQYLRDWLSAQGFTGDGTPPKLTDEVLSELGRRYETAFELITGERLDAALAREG